MSSTVPLTPPVPDRSQRDELGRLVAATWGAAPADGAGRSRRWLVAVDGSEGAMRASSLAAQLAAAQRQAGIDLVHVVPWLTKEAAQGELTQRGWHASATARALMDEAGIPWRLHVRMGEAADQIVGLSEELGSFGIVIGSRGLTRTESLLLGSVAEAVARRCQVPVLLVR